ncbi:ABC transporter substrate-binding protein [Pseudodesulfovibrio sp. S3]|uniref:ABC transporter substrate-binding protein n=1 Tax=unclassified Pseudodesulfovibrio TaxID=2661612 RepID=UPI0013E31EAB|nr:ABC transporter substrate-binding protein [Pseudodesulfovibrio sp. S3]MCJ2166136.1 ABC transporter substrate-binding protein [Pseudodesulfovibrio sp. S3-i]
MLLIAILCMPTAMLAGAKPPPPRVTFISPADYALNPFWDSYCSFMTVAAKSLGVDLALVKATNRFDVMDKAKIILSGENKPDYLIYIYHGESSLTIMGMAETAGVKSFLVNSDIVQCEQDQAGLPREKHPHWIGHIHPDEKLAGYLLAKRLFREAAKLRLTGPDKKVHVVGLGGGLDTMVSIDRQAGLCQALADQSETVLDRFVPTYWDAKVAGEKTRLLHKIHPSATVYWVVSDATALSAGKTLASLGMKPGRDCVLGGVDWSHQGIEAVKRGELVASVGGHFMEGAWALTLILDYHNGRDFADTGTTIQSEMRLIDMDNINKYAPILNRDNWKKIDFKELTKTYNPGLKEYDFSPDAIVRLLAGR